MKVQLICGPIALMAAGFVAAQGSPSFQAALIGSERTSSTAWADYDGDGDLDLAVAFPAGDVRIYRNDRDTFVDAGSGIGLPRKSSGSGIANTPVSLAWGDFDADGDLDLFVGVMVGPGAMQTHLSRNYLYRNEGSRRFVEVATAAGVDLPGADTRQASWIDYDNDGDVDLFVAQRSGYNRLYKNDGGRFQDVSAAVGLFDPRRTVGSCWFDMDQDGDLDVFQANQSGDKDALYRNDQGKFTDIAAGQKIDQPLRTLAQGGVGCSVGDFDNDGDLDLFVATYGENLLYRNDSAGRFEEVAQALGITGSTHAVGASWGDFDNDGNLDLYVAAYSFSNQEVRPDARLYRNEVGRFVNLLENQSALSIADHGVQWADYDRDGGLDLALTNSFKGQYGIWRNGLAKSDRRRSLAVRVLDPDGHDTRAGAEVRLYDRNDKLLSTRLVSTGDGYNSQSVAPVHFGFSKLESVTVEVTFLTPSGRRAQRLMGIDPRNYTGKVLTVKQDPPRS